MARSSTTYSPKWRCGKTCVIRVPKRIADEILAIAWALDTKRAEGHRQSRNKAAILTAKMARLRALGRESEQLRSELGFSPAGELLFSSPTDMTPDGKVVVVADGIGGAVMNVVAGNYPLDFREVSVSRFGSESSAVRRAGRLTVG